MTSTRLPGKVLKEINGKSMLGYHIEHLITTGFHVVIATTTNKEDDAIARFATIGDIDCYRGSEHDVLGRFMQVQQDKKFDIIVRVTSDCPLIDGGLIKSGVERYLERNNELLYLSNCFPRTYARGFDFEIFSSLMLTEANKFGLEKEDREHVTPFLWKNKGKKYTLENISQEAKNGDLRITIDTPEDFELMQKLIIDFGADKLNQLEIEKVLLANPQLIAINALVEQKKV
jgi:spore coat polysaccharide biosynthesis protein SpsF